MDLLAAVILYLWAFWAAYVLVMGLYRAHLAGRLTGLVFALAVPFLVIGTLMDVAANWLIAPVLFLDLPQEALVTQRLMRYKRDPHGWRYKVAGFVCERLLDVFDPTGDHC